jgi:hypothetical protein
MVKLSDLKPGIEKTLEIKEAIVAYLDILGFSKKRDREIEACLVDFPGALVLISMQYPNVRFNVFSDNAIVAADMKEAKDLIAVVRHAFGRWSSNGILVRGGMALGSYFEFKSDAISIARSNFRGYLVSGSGVAKAVKLEDSKPAALLFANKECADLLAHKYGEQISGLGSHYIVAWSHDKDALYWFSAISLIRLLRLLSAKETKYVSIKKKLLYNIKCSIAWDNSGFVYAIMLAILSAPSTNAKAKVKVCKWLGIKQDSFVRYREPIKEWLKDRRRLSFLEALADLDSSMPFTNANW